MIIIFYIYQCLIVDCKKGVDKIENKIFDKFVLCNLNLQTEKGAGFIKMKPIKYVIWGAGEYGRHAFNAVGEEYVEAFLDSNIQKVGTLYCNKEIIDFKQFINHYLKCVLLVANKQVEECCKVAEEHNIYTYIKYENVPSELFSDVGRSELKQYILSRVNKGSLYGIKGLSFYSLIVYFWMKENNTNALLIVNRNISLKMLSLLDLYEITYVFEDEEMTDKLDTIFLCDYVSQNKIKALLFEHKKYCYIFDCSEKIKEYYNPQLECFRKLYNGKRCFLVATGPSLSIADLDLLEKNREICISVNSIFKAFEKTKWKPDYYVIADPIFACENRKIIDSLNITYKLVSDQCVEFWKYEHDNNVIVYHHNASDCCYDFSEDISRVSYAGYTITYICMQIAVYMGFQEIYLLGVDCNYSRGSRNNHFMKEDKPDHMNHNEDKMLLAYQSAKQYADEHDIKIYNATRGGMLEVFERVDFDSLFEDEER